MQATVTIKAKLLKHDIPEFDQLTKRFIQVCNYISDWIFNHDFLLNQIKINHELYYQIRNKFQIKSQLTQSAIRCVVARYKTVLKQLEQRPFHYYDQFIKKSYYVKRDLTWLQYPIRFKKPAADLQRIRSIQRLEIWHG